MRNLFDNLSRQSKRLIMVASDATLLPLALWLAVALRMGDWVPAFPDFYLLILLAPVVAIPVFVKLGLYRAITRYVEDKVLITIVQGVTLSVILLVFIAVVLLRIEGLPRSAMLIYWCIALIYIAGSRMLARAYLRSYNPQGKINRQAVAIYGAGKSGVKLAAALNTGCHFSVVAFIDDNVELQGSQISGVNVFAPKSLAKLFEQRSPKAVLLAIPSASRKRRSEIIAELGKYSVPVKSIPSMTELMNGQAKLDEIREVEIEDLLGRDAVQPVATLLTRCIKGKSVMVTGAGGSIGSELSRQILALQPTHLVLFEKSEFDLYQIEQELNATNAALGGMVKIISILGSVTHQHRVERVLQAFGVQTVYHAAAYKHVPLVEHNLIEGVINNVFGTWRTAAAAKNTGVETFVLVSTDKAVRPTNVMGASKRFSELVLQAFAREDNKTRYCMVRFGNVLGSSGSVVPLFKKQIAHGGPITVTHPEITRYFMTIPEAAGLVLQAGSMGKGGDVFVLDMGASVKIVDLARRMIKLSGLSVRDVSNPEGDIAIEFSGLRPGEKLYEELLIGDNVLGTEHPLIMRAEEVELPWTVLQEKLQIVDLACHQFDCEAVRKVLLEVVDGYAPTSGICDHVWEARRDHQ
ncbi:MAG: nucleoside-diphosphate sugar epimerase/dehydratase [Gallionella sp.]|nr:nucleoside-diphosphate sugar epimerase/dehydratase [Gallionella sp.]